MSSGKQRNASAQQPAGSARQGNQNRSSNRAARIAAQKKAQQRRQLITWLGAGLAIAIAAVGAIIVINNLSADGETNNTGPASVATIVPGLFIDSSIPMDGMALGNADAPITVVEYGDYQCPFCVRFQGSDMDTLISEYIQTGLIRFEYHEFPIIDSKSDGSFDQDGESFRAAEAAMCANDQGQYWPYHNLLYANSLGEHVGSFSTDRLKRMAEQTPGLDLETFNACVDNRTHRDTVQQMANEAQTAGINSTPTFVINGRPVSGADYGAIKDVIEEQLAGP